MVTRKWQKKFLRHVEISSWIFLQKGKILLIFLSYFGKGRRKFPQSIKASMKNRKAVVFLPLLIFAWAIFIIKEIILLVVRQRFMPAYPTYPSWWKNNESQHVSFQTNNVRFFVDSWYLYRRNLLIRFLSLHPIIFLHEKIKKNFTWRERSLILTITFCDQLKDTFGTIVISLK